MAKPKILYAFQRTGNGHTSRAIEIIPFLKEYADVDILTSGSNSQLDFPFEIKYNYKGISLFYGKKGSISFLKTLFKNNYYLFFKNIFSFPLKKYDLIINDFEPITAWAKIYKRAGNIIGLSHQAALLYNESPRPVSNSFFMDLIIKYYAPTKKKYGFHFKKYNNFIFYPIIRNEIREIIPEYSNFFLVYLPSYSNKYLENIFNDTSENWQIFSPEIKKIEQKNNCTFYPINNKLFLESLANCKGVVCGGGFELPAEVMYLNKKLLVIPIKNQREQEYNATALEQIGVLKGKKLTLSLINEFIKQEKTYFVDALFPDEEFKKFIKTLLENTFKR